VGLIHDIRGGPVGLDTVVFIYLIEEHPRFLPLVEPVFAAVDAGRIEAVSSSLTLLEVLVVPYRAGDLGLAHRYEELLTRSGGLRLIEIGRAQLRSAAQLRGLHRTLKTPDALQLCAALAGGCKTFVTNDRRLPPISGLRILQLKDYALSKE
jgi:predicted nucleic acid-binding protein